MGWVELFRPLRQTRNGIGIGDDIANARQSQNHWPCYSLRTRRLIFLPRIFLSSRRRILGPHALKHPLPLFVSGGVQQVFDAMGNRVGVVVGVDQTLRCESLQFGLPGVGCELQDRLGE